MSTFLMTQTPGVSSAQRALADLDFWTCDGAAGPICAAMGWDRRRGAYRRLYAVACIVGLEYQQLGERFLYHHQ